MATLNRNQLTVFDKPELIDALINDKLDKMPAKNGKANSIQNKWKPEELELRDAVILQYICDQGLSRERAAQQIFSRWHISLGTARNWIHDAIERFAKAYNDEDGEEQRRTWLARCEQILQDAIDTGDKANALKALDLMGKSMGIYQEKKDINLDGQASITFEFQ